MSNNALKRLAANVLRHLGEADNPHVRFHTRMLCTGYAVGYARQLAEAVMAAADAPKPRKRKRKGGES